MEARPAPHAIICGRSSRRAGRSGRARTTNANEKEDVMAKHMTLDTRKGIAHGLECRLTFAQMATMFGRAVSTIANEVKNRMRWSNRNYGCTNAVCEHFETCSKVYRNADGRKAPFKSQRRCFEMCEDFRQRTCDDLGRAPYVCNGCDRQARCPLRKRYYVADAAQTNYRGTLTESRRGTHATDEERSDMSDALLAPVKFGRQSIGMVMAAAKERFHGFSERTVYRLANSGLLSVGRSDLVQACSRRPRKDKSAVAVTKTDAKCRVGRTYEEYLAFLALNFGVQVVELDTVIGAVGGKVLFTLMFACGLMLAFLRDARTSQTCTRIFNMLQAVAGVEFFKTLFPAILTDNGPEFSDPRMIEFYRVDPEHNPTKLARRTYVFFCDPYNSQQKPHVERNHEEIRRVLVKGTSFDTLRQEDINLMLSHVNSAPRPSLDGKTPYDEFVSFYGERGREFLDRLGIRRVNAESVVLDPMLLGEKFKREANRAILHRHGVL